MRWSATISVLLLPVTAMSGGPELNWHTIDGGAGTLTGGGLELTGSIGQPDAGELSGATLELSGGFLVAAFGGEIPGDCDQDGDIDNDDYVCFEACLSGPEISLPSGCESLDFDEDDDVDLTDFSAFTRAFTVN